MQQAEVIKARIATEQRHGLHPDCYRDRASGLRDTLYELSEAKSAPAEGEL